MITQNKKVENTYSMKKALVLLVSFICYQIVCHAQVMDEHYYFKNLSVQNGLSQNTVNAILQDKQGFMWFGTKDGLNRYDGLSFRQFKHDGRSQRSIGNNFITALYEDAEGNIWVGTDVGLYIYYPENDSFRHFEELSAEETKIEHTVTAIVGDDQRCVWIAVESQGLFCYDLEKEKLQNFTLKNFPFISTNVQSFVFDNSGTLWIGCYGDGLFYSKDRLKTLQPYISPVDNKETFENDVVTTLVKGAYNCLYIGSLRGGAKELNLTSNKLHDLLSVDENEEPVHSIRRQSEGIYAILHFLAYEKKQGRKYPEWEQRVKQMFEMFLKLQNADGSFPRKFRDDFTIVDKSGGSTPSATLPLVLGYKYFKDKRYLASARKTAEYLEKELISKADYFSSTLDANCEDKEASLYAATATYYLSLITKGEEHKHYADLTKKAAYFALSWYYLWDVPFAPGQMLGDIGMKTRGWGNVSVENNHIDVFVFEFADVLRWLSKEYKENRLSDFAEVISTSMRQLLPHEGHMCGIAKVGYYPEVVQHTNWDYGKNGKGYYNDIFAPGWTVASLWELYTPGRAETFLKK